MPSLHSYALVSVGDTKTFLGIETPTYDSLFTILINQATDYIEKKTGRRFKQDTYTNELYNGEGSRDLIIKNYPIVSVSAVGKRTVLDNSDNWEAIDAEDYFIDENAGIITRISDFWVGTENYRVTYVGGYSTIPSDLQYACMMLVSEAFNRRKGAGIKSESLGDHSIVFETVAQSTDRVMEIIRSYKRVTVL